MREEFPRKGMEVHPPEERGIGLKRLGGSGEGLSTFKALLVFYAALSWSWSDFQTFNGLFCRKDGPEAATSNSR